jgi:DNA-binding response OmpR family regulator
MAQRQALRGNSLLMLTARGDEVDRVAGLDAGADDYIVKPFFNQRITGTHPSRFAKTIT